jgi:hypothetical protein
VAINLWPSCPLAASMAYTIRRSQFIPFEQRTLFSFRWRFGLFGTPRRALRCEFARNLAGAGKSQGEARSSRETPGKARQLVAGSLAGSSRQGRAKGGSALARWQGRALQGPAPRGSRSLACGARLAGKVDKARQRAATPGRSTREIALTVLLAAARRLTPFAIGSRPSDQSASVGRSGSPASADKAPS